jgi:hypothetical protein
MGRGTKHYPLARSCAKTNVTTCSVWTKLCAIKGGHGQSPTVRTIHKANMWWICTVSKKETFARHWWRMPVILTSWEAEIKGIKVWGQPRQVVYETQSPKITKAKWTGHMAQVVEYLFCKCKALVQTSVPPKKERWKKQTNKSLLL